MDILDIPIELYPALSPEQRCILYAALLERREAVEKDIERVKAVLDGRNVRANTLRVKPEIPTRRHFCRPRTKL